MAFNIFSVVTVYELIILLQCSFHIVMTDKSLKPYIRSEYETIKATGDNYTILCQGSEPLGWSWPKYNLNFTTGTIVNVEDVIPENSTFKYASRLFLFNLTYHFTGFYNCYNKLGNKNEEENFAKIYLYVKDDNNLSVNEDEVITVLATQYTDATIPCRPTSPDVKVELSEITGDSLLMDTIYGGGSLFRFHPHYGFITNRTSELRQDIFTCSFTSSSALDNYTATAILDIEPKIMDLPEPSLEEVSGGHTVVGQVLVLKCSIRTSVTVSTVWETPNGRFDGSDKRVNISSLIRDPVNNDITTQSFSITNVTLQDQGLYTCNVADKQQHDKSKTINVTLENISKQMYAKRQ